MEIIPAIGKEGLKINDTSMRPSVVKLPFGLRHGVLLQSSIELAASLYVRVLSASNELLSVLASLARHPMLYSLDGNSGRIRAANSNWSRKIRRVSTELIFQTHIDRFAKLISELS